MAILKADAYGHGAVPVARALDAADAFGVARLSEGVALRDSGIRQPICLLQGIHTEQERQTALAAALELVVHADHQLELLARAKDCHRVWIKVDTGMGRLGFPPAGLASVVQQLHQHSLVGVMTHLANADATDKTRTEAQLDIALNKQFFNKKLRITSIGNSAGIINYPRARSDWIRPGIMLCGASPFQHPAPLETLQPAMTLSAPVIAIQSVAAGCSVGYGGLWTADQDTQVAVLALGYADGYPREIKPGTPVLLGPGKRPIAGRVSMDMISVRLEPGDRVQVGDRAILWGEGLPIEIIADCAGTIPYRLLTGVSARVERDWVGGRI